MKQIIINICLLVSCCICSISQADISDDVFNSRLKFEAGHVDILVEIKVRNRNPNGFTAEKHEWDVAFRGEEIRNISVLHMKKRGSWYTMPEQRVLTSDSYIYDAQGETVAVVMDNAREITGAAKDDLFDPRLIGLIACRDIKWDNYGLENAVSWLRGAKVIGEEKDLEGFAIKHYIVGDNENPLYQAWICPSKDFAVVKAEWRRGGGIRRTVETTYQEHKAGPHETFWFPKDSDYKEFQGDNLRHHETTTVRDIRYGADDEVFTLASLNLPKGTAVRNHGDKFVWNGSSLVEDPRWKPHAATTLEPNENSTRRWTIWLNALIVATLGAFILFRYFRNRKYA